MLKERYYIKIVPHRGETVHRFALARNHIIIAASSLAIIIFGSLLFASVQVARAHAQVAQFRTQATAEQSRISKIDHTATALQAQLSHLQRENSEIQKLIGVKVTPPRGLTHTSRSVPHARTLSDVEARLNVLSRQSAQTAAMAKKIHSAALIALNMRRQEAARRASELAAIPSIDPVEGSPVIGCFCYRSYPDVEFHEGVDIAADYGTPVRASAAGTVVAASYDGGYGLKVDIDHGNGYHTWYAHLEAALVTVGQHVYKGEVIGHAGATGFATGPHLHYQIMLNGVAINPTPYLSGVPANVLAAL